MLKKIKDTNQGGDVQEQLLIWEIQMKKWCFKNHSSKVKNNLICHYILHGGHNCGSNLLGSIDSVYRKFIMLPGTQKENIQV
jgi:hypothetical protein